MVSVLLEEAERALALDDMDAAERAFLGVLEQEPLNAVARLGLAEIRRVSSTAVERPVSVRLAVETDSLAGKVANPDEAFVLSRLASGALRLDDLLQQCPLPAPQVLAILEKYVRDGTVCLER